MNMNKQTTSVLGIYLHDRKGQALSAGRVQGVQDKRHNSELSNAKPFVTPMFRDIFSVDLFITI